MTIESKFVVFEGGEAAGKTTHLHALRRWFIARDIECIATREPGGIEEAEYIRDALLFGENSHTFLPKTRLLLFLASRVEHVEKVIRPALQQGKWVLCDRFVDSTKIYQGIGEKIGVELVESLHTLLFQDLVPNITFFIDVPVKTALKRAQNRRSQRRDYYETLQESFHNTIREGFLVLFNSGSKFKSRSKGSPAVRNVYKIDGMQSKKAVTDRICNIMKDFVV